MRFAKAGLVLHKQCVDEIQNESEMENVMTLQSIVVVRDNNHNVLTLS